MGIDYISAVPCPVCHAYRHKDEMSVGRRMCLACEKEYWAALYKVDVDQLIREQEQEAQYARMTDSGIILLGD
jgi:hypothetical protein